MHGDHQHYIIYQNELTQQGICGHTPELIHSCSLLDCSLEYPDIVLCIQYHTEPMTSQVLQQWQATEKSRVNNHVQSKQ